MDSRKEVKLKNMLAYGVGDLYGGGSFFIIGALLMVFLTDAAGLTPIQAGIVVAAGKIWDAVTDPAMGYISDHTRSKLGRRKVYFLIGILPIFISFAILWIHVKFGQTYNFLYYIFTYMFFCTVFTTVMIPYNTLGAEMTSEFKVRSKMTGVRMFFSQFSVLLGGFFPQKIISAFPGENGYLVMAVIFGVLFALSWIFVYKGTWESGTSSGVMPKESFRIGMKRVFEDFSSAFLNKSFRVHISMYLSSYLAMDVFNALMIYFITYYLKKESAYSNTLAVLVIAQIISILAVTFECMKKGNGFAYRLHMAAWGIAIFIFGLFTPQTGIVFFYLVAVLLGFGLSGAVMVPYNILPFMSDVDEVMTSRRREGIYAGLMTFVRKIAQAIALFLVGVGLDTIGYRANEVQSASTLAGLKGMIIYIPLALIIIGFAVSFMFKVTPENHRILLDEIGRLKNGGSKKEVDGNTRRVLENITGRDYNNLWI